MDHNGQQARPHNVYFLFGVLNNYLVISSVKVTLVIQLSPSRYCPLNTDSNILTVVPSVQKWSNTDRQRDRQIARVL